MTTHTGGIEGGFAAAKVKYQTTLQKRSREYTFGTDPARSRGALIDIVELMREEGARPVVLIDDTDKFAPGDDIDETAVPGLFDHAVQSLAELKIDFVVAVHQRFQATDAYQRVSVKYLSTRLEVPYLAIERRPLLAILDRHLVAAGLELRAAEVVDEAAIDTLQGIYGGRGRDLRQVLHVAHRAAAVAEERRAEAYRCRGHLTDHRAGLAGTSAAPSHDRSVRTWYLHRRSTRPRGRGSASPEVRSAG